MKRTLGAILFFSFFLFPFFTHAQDKIKILLVPGHDSEVWGAQYGALKEAAMNLAVANRIYNILKKDENFDVHITRDADGYTKEFTDYFSNNKEEVLSFEQKAKQQLQDLIKNGGFIQKENVAHNKVTGDIALRLYGFNKWANENNMDAVIHIHFNDYPRPTIWTIGKYKGFAIYIPDAQFANASSSGKLAASILTQLNKKYITSTYLKEKGGLISDQKLIALGSNGTLSDGVRSLLIEYGYIYRFGDKVARYKAYDNMASLTVTGIKNYFFERET